MDRFNEEKCIEILKKVEKTQDITIENLEVNIGTQDGDNYSGSLYAVDLKARINGIDRQFKWMVKMTPTEETKNNFNKGLHMEEKECLVYNQLIPNFYELIKNKNSDIQLNYCPIYYANYDKETNNNTLIIMENLKTKGYELPEERKKGLNLDYIKIVMDEIAKFHALGYSQINSHPNGTQGFLDDNKLIVRDYFISDMEPDTKIQFDNVIKHTIQSYFVIMEIIQKSGEDFVSLLRRFDEKVGMHEEFTRLYKLDKNHFNTLIHGDLWFNNMIFGYKNNEPKNVILLDLAMIRYGNPAQDLAYFLFQSMHPKDRKVHFNEIMKHYHDSLRNYLEKLGEDPNVYSYEQLLEDYKRYKYTGLFISLWVLPFVICKKEDTIPADMLHEVDFNNVEQVAEFARKAQELMLKSFKKTPLIESFLGGNFRELYEEGYFDDI